MYTVILADPTGKEFWFLGIAPPSRNMILRAKIIYSGSPTNTHICKNYQITRRIVSLDLRASHLVTGILRSLGFPWANVENPSYKYGSPASAREDVKHSKL